MLLTRLDRYVGIHILGAFCVVMLVLLGLMGISMLLDELGDVDARYHLSDALVFVLLSLPATANQLLPLSALVATLVGLGMLASTSELTVMRASGLSLARLILTVLKPVMLLAFAALLLSEFVVPIAQQSAAGYKIEKQGAAKAQSANAGASMAFTTRYWVFLSLVKTSLLKYVFHCANAPATWVDRSKGRTCTCSGWSALPIMMV